MVQSIFQIFRELLSAESPGENSSSSYQKTKSKKTTGGGSSISSKNAINTEGSVEKSGIKPHSAEEFRNRARKSDANPESSTSPTSSRKERRKSRKFSDPLTSQAIKKISRYLMKGSTAGNSEQYFEDSVIQKELVGKKDIHERRRFWFVLGILLGMLLTAVMVKKTEYAEMRMSYFQDYLINPLGDISFYRYFQMNMPTDFFGLNMTSGLNFDWKADENIEHEFEHEEKRYLQTSGLFEPAKTLKKEKGLKAKHPVVMVPGAVTSGLENWSTKGCFQKYFRKRVWGTVSMLQALLSDRACWLEHMTLDEKTGLDPPGIRLRAAKGLESADYFMTGYWVWAKVIDNLSELGYDNNNMHMASYDWRLSLINLEKRDGYFTQLKTQIELLKKINNEKVVLISHSMGAPLILSFLKWVESDKLGKGGEGWVNEHVEAWVNIAGALLGAPKILPGILSGETKETVQPFSSYILEGIIGKRDRARLYRSWGSFGTLLPKGGTRVWGDARDSPEDLGRKYKNFSYGSFFTIREKSENGNMTTKNLTVSESIELALETIDPQVRTRVSGEIELGVFDDVDQFEKNKDNFATFSNPLTLQLPNAPNMTIYSMYGVGVPSERGYYYKKTDESNDCDQMKNTGGVEAKACDKRDNGWNYMIDVTVSDPKHGVSNGVIEGDGDGSVNLLSLGYMPAHGWNLKKYNPHGVKTVTREYIQRRISAIGYYLGRVYTDSNIVDHVGILGNHNVLVDIARIVSGKDVHKTNKDKIFSHIKKASKKVKISS